MKLVKSITTSLAAALLLAITASVEPGYAQQPQPAQTPTADIVVVTACVAREADYTRTTARDGAAANGAQLLLVSADAAAPIHGLTGLREEELAAHVGQRVEVTGTVERPRTVGLITTATGTREGSVNSGAPGAAGITPQGGPAHEPTDALAGTVRAGAVSNPGTRSADPAYDLAVLPRLNATAFRVVGGTCATPARQTAASAAASPPAPAAQAQLPLPLSRQTQPITAVGCLVRQTASGTARTPNGSADPLALTGASVATPRAAAGGSAVPGSAAPASGTGTVPNAIGTTGGAPVDAGQYAFELSAGPDQFRQLAQHVGERVEIVGTLADTSSAEGRAPLLGPASGASEGIVGRVEAPPPLAHTSAPAQRVTVTSFRALGNCN